MGSGGQSATAPATSRVGPDRSTSARSSAASACEVSATTSARARATSFCRPNARCSAHAMGALPIHGTARTVSTTQVTQPVVPDSRGRSRS